MLHDVDFSSLGESPDMRKGETYSMTFDTPGTYSYICGIHLFMKGTVEVA
jgi:plastocyanin